jgi:CMP-N-acetylneuraminic acid synthetase/regulator of RNase E activity RraA
MKIVAFLPVKAASDRVYNKNTRLIDGKPLFLYSLEKLVEMDIFDSVYLDTESSEIVEMASEVDCKIMNRDPSLATNKTDGNKLMLNQFNHVQADIYLQLLATSPFISKETIAKAVDILITTDYDSVLLVKKDKIYSWLNGVPSYDINNIPNSIDLPDVLIETMGLYAIKADSLRQTGRRIGINPYFLEVSPLEAIDVNYPEEFQLAEIVATGCRQKECALFRSAKHILSSALLSDILDDLGYPNQVVKGLVSNGAKHKIFGRAKTLKLRGLSAGESVSGIYDALFSYDSVVADDVIVVENEVSEYAYFGELNTHLAIRAGAAGAIIAGKTRDSSAVERLDFPVYSTGFACQDVRGRATLDSVNKTISLNGVLCPPSSLIFADHEGVVVVPKIAESLVFQYIHERLGNEKSIISDISRGVPISKIVENYGAF